MRGFNSCNNKAHRRDIMTILTDALKVGTGLIGGTALGVFLTQKFQQYQYQKVMSAMGGAEGGMPMQMTPQALATPQAGQNLDLGAAQMSQEEQLQAIQQLQALAAQMGTTQGMPQAPGGMNQAVPAAPIQPETATNLSIDPNKVKRSPVVMSNITRDAVAGIGI